jgi:DnaJ family protein C protein 11
MELESLVHSKNDITVNINATKVFREEEILSPFGGTSFAKRSKGGILSALKRTEIMQLHMKNSFEVKNYH